MPLPDRRGCREAACPKAPGRLLRTPKERRRSGALPPDAKMRDHPFLPPLSFRSWTGGGWCSCSSCLLCPPGEAEEECQARCPGFACSPSMLRPPLSPSSPFPLQGTQGTADKCFPCESRVQLARFPLYWCLSLPLSGNLTRCHKSGPCQFKSIKENTSGVSDYCYQVGRLVHGLLCQAGATRLFSKGPGRFPPPAGQPCLQG